MPKAKAKGSEEIDAIIEMAHSNAVRGVEIFGTGTHNGDEYTEKDIDDMVAAFAKLDFRPALKIGHTKDKPGAPSYGWITNLKKVGTKLVADFESMHDSVVAALKDKRYDRVSSEIYFNLKRGEKTFRRALKAVALLGAEVPAVAGLTPLHKMEFAADGFESVAACEQALDVDNEAIAEALSERLAGMIKALSEKEHDMKTIEQLKADKAALEKQLAVFTAKGDKLSDEDKAAMNKLAADVKAFGEQIEGQEKAAKDLAEANAQIKKLTDDAAARDAEVKKLADKDRAREVADRVSKCTVPAFRGHAEALYQYAFEHADAEVKIFATDKEGKRTETKSTLVALADGIIASINEQAKRLFVTTAGRPGEQRQEGADEDAGVEVDRKTKAYMLAHKVEDYSEAMTAVLAADADLTRRYAEQQGAGGRVN